MTLTARIVSQARTLDIPGVPTITTEAELRALAAGDTYSRASVSAIAGTPSRRMRGGDVVLESGVRVEYVDQRAAAVKDYHTGGSFGTGGNIDAAIATAISEQVLPWGKDLLIHPGDHTINATITPGIGARPVTIRGFNSTRYGEPSSGNPFFTRVYTGSSFPAADSMVKMYGGGWRVCDINLQATQACKAIIEWAHSGSAGTNTQPTIENCLLYGNPDSAARYAQYGILQSETVVGNYEYMIVSRVAILGCNGDGIKITSNTGQAKALNFDDVLFFGIDGYGINLVSGSFLARGIKFGQVDTACMYIGGAADFIEIQDIDSETCARLIVTGGPAANAHDILVDGCRFATDGLAADGAYIQYLLRGTLTLRGMMLDFAGSAGAANAARLRAHVQCATTVRTKVVSIGNTWGNARPFRPAVGSYEGIDVDQLGDKYAYTAADGAPIDGNDPFRHIPSRLGEVVDQLEAKQVSAAYVMLGDYDARDLVDIYANGAEVLLWNDRSTARNDLDEGADATFERFGLGGMPCVRGDGAAGWLGNTGGTMAAALTGSDKAYTAVWVGEQVADGTGIFFEFDRTTDTSREGVYASTDNLAHIRVSSGGSSVNTVAGIGTWGSGVHVYALVFTGTTIKLYVDGAQVGATTACDVESMTLDTFTLFAARINGAAAASFGNYRVGCLKMWAAELADQEIADLYVTLRNNWREAF